MQISKTKMESTSDTLPVVEHKDMLIAAVLSSHCVVIVGETGCGKTTQLPQFLLDALTEEKKSKRAIAVTQVLVIRLTSESPLKETDTPPGL
jgi:ATP-dependent RNA helicase DHX57